MREARTVAVLDHPHICTLHDIGSQDVARFDVRLAVAAAVPVARFYARVVSEMKTRHGRDQRPREIRLNTGTSRSGRSEVVQIPVEALSRQALDGLIEEFVTRDGTDYGTEERSLNDKKDAVWRQLDCGEIVIVFDPETETSNIISKDDLRAGALGSSTSTERDHPQRVRRS